jgi:hypothetical protein
MSIYPTVLYIKQHSITGLKYFGKTTEDDPYKYLGSGKHWSRHIKTHGKEHIETLWVSEPYTDSDLISEFALAFSKEHNIVQSEEWANLIPETGLDGWVKGATRKPFTGDHRAKMSASKMGNLSRLGKPQTEESKAKRKDKPQPPESGTSSASQSGSKYWNDGVRNYKVKVWEFPDSTWVMGRISKPRAAESGAKISAYQKGAKWWNDGARNYKVKSWELPDSTWVIGKIKK